MYRKQYQILASLAAIAFLIALMLLISPTNAVMAEGPVGVDVVASNLDNPRGMTFGPDGGLYIAEAGRGGDAPCFEGAEGQACYGATGAITRVLNGQQERMAMGLPSLGGAEGNNATGPHDVAFDTNGTLHVIIGLGADPAVRETLGDVGGNFGQLASVSSSGELTNVADVAAFEGTNNPDGTQIDSNPFGVAAYSGGIAVTDAGANDLLHVMPTRSQSVLSTTISTLTVFPTRTVEFPPTSGSQVPMQAVPTGVAEGPDGALYIGELTGFPFPVGGARVYRFVSGEQPTIYADGFTNIIDVAFDSAGNLYVLELAANSLLSGNTAGALIRVAPDGTRETIVAGSAADSSSREAIVGTTLVNPTGVVVGSDGMVYVSNNGRVAENGQVIRIDPNQGPTALTLNGLHSNQAPSGIPAGTWALLGLTAMAGLLFLLRRKR